MDNKITIRPVVIYKRNRLEEKSMRIYKKVIRSYKKQLNAEVTDLHPDVIYATYKGLLLQRRILKLENWIRHFSMKIGYKVIKLKMNGKGRWTIE
jgi:hypothetical protein